MVALGAALTLGRADAATIGAAGCDGDAFWVVVG
jgi:hypothetical protein